MDKLSVAVITKNEEKNIARCLDSVKGLADEIVVVDSFSTDRTKELCLERGAKFSENPFAGHIEQKNHAFSLCTFAHILSLDADEALSDELYGSILKVKELGFGDGYSMNRRTRYCGKWIRFGGWYPDRKIRLVRNGVFAWAGQNPHDELMSQTPVKVEHLKGDLLHYSINTLEEHKRVVENFSTIAANAMFQKNRRPGPIKKYASAIFKFVQSYIVRLGFLEGIHGWNIARLSAKAKYLKYKKLENLYKGTSK
jgi:glycosyltransferase involved in cell wall biosynthesis